MEKVKIEFSEQKQNITFDEIIDYVVKESLKRIEEKNKNVASTKE